jgi:molybdopterin/thiamine biosynthesis adenylyltransferase
MSLALKDCVWRRHDGLLTVVVHSYRRIELRDPSGRLETALALLSAQPRTAAELAAAAEISPGNAQAVLALFDRLGLIEAAEGRAYPDSDHNERFASNLAFFEYFSSADKGRTGFQERLLHAHVLQLGVGGLGCATTQCLAGYGIGRLTLVDPDVVERSNFTRQFLYRRDQIGLPKVDCAAEWVRAFDPDIAVAAVRRMIADPSDLADLLDDVDVVIAAVDTPADVTTWIGDACVQARTPYVTGGMMAGRLVYYSVDPGVSPCYRCYLNSAAVTAERTGPDGDIWSSMARHDPANPTIAAAAMMLGSHVALEAMRYLTGFQPPIAAGRLATIDLHDGAAIRVDPWPADPDCTACLSAMSDPHRV